MSPKPNLIIIAGPTGVGKTAAAVDMAKEFNGEIIGADSMQIYKYMNIGTAKPAAEELQGAPHHMISVFNPDEPYDAARFSTDARKLIKEIVQRNRTPFLAGGTGLYIKTALYGIFTANPPKYPDTAAPETVFQNTETAKPHDLLKQIDPAAAEKIHPNDTYRIRRALQVFHETGRSIFSHHGAHGFPESPFNPLKIVLMTDRDQLYEKIDRRVDAMIADGLMDEVKELLNRGYSHRLKSMQSIGYRHMGACIRGEISFEEAVRTLKRDTRRYAKRQLTWFKADPEYHWVEPEDRNRIKSLIARFLNLK